MRALAKVVFAVLESKYGGGGRKKKGSSGKKEKKVEVGAGKKRKGSIDEEDSVYEVDVSFVSDDSRRASTQAYMEAICAELDPLQVSKVCLLLLSRDYVNSNAAQDFHL